MAKTAKKSIAQLREQFIESIGLVAQGEGLPRIAGRMFGMMVFDNGPFSFSELAELLLVSRGSVSSSARMLEEKGLIKRVTRPGDRQDYFQLAKNPYATLLKGAVARSVSAKNIIADVANQIPAKSRETKKRLDDYAAFYAALEESMNSVIESVHVDG